MVFTGNISSGRYKSLGLIGKAIKRINANGKKIELDIYTKTPMTKKMTKTLNIEGVNFLGGISADKVNEVQNDADILVHAESFDRKNMLLVRQSFSTKIVDYLYRAKCIFAVGPHNVASIDYLKKNDAAIVSNKKELERDLRKLVDNTDIICEYGQKAWICGERNHQLEEIQGRLYDDFKLLLEK